jgi:hypothetical protein
MTHPQRKLRSVVAGGANRLSPDNVASSARRRSSSTLGPHASDSVKTTCT